MKYDPRVPGHLAVRERRAPRVASKDLNGRSEK